MKFHRSPHALLLLALALWLSACEKPTTPADYPGTYAYRSPGGQVEAIVVEPDLSYRHLLYNTELDFIDNAAPLFLIKDKMQPDGDGGYDMQILPLHMQDGYHYEPGESPTLPMKWKLEYYPSSILNLFQRPAIAIFSDRQYCLYKVDNREEIRTIKYHYGS